MKVLVRLLRPLGSRPAGTIVSLRADRAAALIAWGGAEPVRRERAQETAVTGPQERTSRMKRRNT